MTILPLFFPWSNLGSYKDKYQRVDHADKTADIFIGNSKVGNSPTPTAQSRCKIQCLTVGKPPFDSVHPQFFNQSRFFGAEISILGRQLGLTDKFHDSQRWCLADPISFESGVQIKSCWFISKLSGVILTSYIYGAITNLSGRGPPNPAVDFG